MDMQKLAEERWNNAIAHALEMLKMYSEIGPNGAFGVITISTKIDLYEKGDRSKVLLSALEGIE